MEKIGDLETTLEINKKLIDSLLVSQDENVKEVYKKLNDENLFLKKRLK